MMADLWTLLLVVLMCILYLFLILLMHSFIYDRRLLKYFNFFMLLFNKHVKKNMCFSVRKIFSFFETMFKFVLAKITSLNQ